MSETRETALEQRLRDIAGDNGYGDFMGAQWVDTFDIARDLVRCWREYLAVLDDPKITVTETFALVAEARALLARGDAL